MLYFTKISYFILMCTFFIIMSVNASKIILLNPTLDVHKIPYSTLRTALINFKNMSILLKNNNYHFLKFKLTMQFKNILFSTFADNRI